MSGDSRQSRAEPLQNLSLREGSRFCHLHVAQKLASLMSPLPGLSTIFGGQRALPIKEMRKREMTSNEITIPTEVLCEIFHLLCDEPIPLHDLENDSHLHEFPWAVGQVCRHWRGAFLSYTPLWTSFALRPGYYNHLAKMTRRAITYIKRSGQQPLTIVVSTPRLEYKVFPEKVWRILLSCSKRWKKANLVLDNSAVIDELRILCMSSLESLTVSIPNSLTILKKPQIVAPRLTELDITHPGYTSTWEFPWAQLTKLKMEVAGEDLCIDDDLHMWGVLFQLEKIEELHVITQIYYLGPKTSLLPIIHLPSLRLLDISLPFPQMFSWFTAPLLEHLCIRTCSHYFPDVFYPHLSYVRELTSLIQRSSCHIRRLEVVGSPREELLMIIKSLTSVEELSIQCPGSTEELQDIAMGLSDCVYLPKLQWNGLLVPRVHDLFLEFLCAGNGIDLNERKRVALQVRRIGIERWSLISTTATLQRANGIITTKNPSRSLHFGRVENLNVTMFKPPRAGKRFGGTVPRMLFATGDDGYVFIWSLPERQFTHKFHAGQGPIMALEWFDYPNFVGVKYLVSAGTDGTVKQLSNHQRYMFIGMHSVHELPIENVALHYSRLDDWCPGRGQALPPMPPMTLLPTLTWKPFGRIQPPGNARPNPIHWRSKSPTPPARSPHPTQSRSRLSVNTMPGRQANSGLQIVCSDVAGSYQFSNPASPLEKKLTCREI
ncbi:hypothetical protein F5887DRAFT_928166 [Amanita rubescens]|nr:hypothetical protein F5887DRAFT_928166 [Amanita rubescens]